MNTVTTFDWRIYDESVFETGAPPSAVLVISDRVVTDLVVADAAVTVMAVSDVHAQEE